MKGPNLGKMYDVKRKQHASSVNVPVELELSVQLRSLYTGHSLPVSLKNSGVSNDVVQLNVSKGMRNGSKITLYHHGWNFRFILKKEKDDVF